MSCYAPKVDHLLNELRQSDISQLLQLYTKCYPIPKILLQQNKLIWQLHWTRSITSYSLTTLCIWHKLCFYLAQTTKTLRLSKLQNYLNSLYLTQSKEYQNQQTIKTLAQTIKSTLVQILLIAFDVHACPMMFPLFALEYFLHFSSLPKFFLSLLLITLNASVLFSRLCPGTGHIDYNCQNSHKPTF